MTTRKTKQGKQNTHTNTKKKKFAQYLFCTWAEVALIGLRWALRSWGPFTFCFTWAFSDTWDWPKREVYVERKRSDLK